MHHTLYSFRRCPYAMRARMALHNANILVEVHDIDLKNRPVELLDISPKGSVPVLKLTNGTIIDESLDIMRWALEGSDPDCWLVDDTVETEELIALNDGDFKRALDRYKYSNRFPDEDCSGARDQGVAFLKRLNQQLESSEFLCADHVSLCDIAIFPFIRQFAHVDKDWFNALPLPKLQSWLALHLESVLFETIMHKHKEAYMLSSPL